MEACTNARQCLRSYYFRDQSHAARHSFFACELFFSVKLNLFVHFFVYINGLDFKWSMKTISMNKETEQRLAELERIVVERQDWLFRFAYMRIGTRMEAEDVVQEVLMGVFQRLRDEVSVSNVEQYLIRAVSNACNDHFRRRSMQTVPLDKALQVPIDEEDRKIHDEYVRVSKLLDNIPTEQAEIVRLKCYDGLTFRQISEIQDIPEATAKSRYRYAIQHIQQMIKKGDKT